MFTSPSSIIDEEAASFEIHDVYKIDQQAENIETVRYGKWKKKIGLTIYDRNIWKRRSDLKGYNIRFKL